MVESMTRPTHPLRILVVEDDSESLQLMGALLSLWGYKTSLRPDGPAALAAVRHEMPDVVLLDLGLPGMDGFEVARQLRSYPGSESLLIVAVTAYRGEGHRRRALKPVDIESLRLVLSQASRSSWSAADTAVTPI